MNQNRQQILSEIIAIFTKNKLDGIEGLRIAKDLTMISLSMKPLGIPYEISDKEFDSMLKKLNVFPSLDNIH